VKIENWRRIKTLVLPQIAKLICHDAAPAQNYLFGYRKSLPRAMAKHFTLIERLGSEAETKWVG